MVTGLSIRQSSTYLIKSAASKLYEVSFVFVKSNILFRQVLRSKHQSNCPLSRWLVAAGRLENGNTTSIYVSIWSESVIFSKYYWGCTSKDCSSKFRSKHSTVLLLCSPRNLLEQSLKAFCIQIKILQFFYKRVILLIIG